MSEASRHTWAFKPRFRRHAYGWRSQPAIARIAEAVSEIKGAARTDPVLAADGAVQLLERISPAIEQVDGSSGAIGGAVNRAIETLAAIIAAAQVSAAKREAWLERLWEAHQNDEMGYLDSLADLWGGLARQRQRRGDLARLRRAPARIRICRRGVRAIRDRGQ